MERARALWKEPWSAAAPTATPRGLADPKRAVEAFAWAVEETVKRHGRADIAWGDVHRVRFAGKDVPVGGCTGGLGCFRVLWYENEPDGKRRVTGGDGWVLAVEFGKVPRAFSVLAYGVAGRPDSPFHGDQVEMFARNEMKRVLFTRAEVEKGTVRKYRPGE